MRDLRKSRTTGVPTAGTNSPAAGGAARAGSSEVSVDELMEILKNDLEMTAQSLRGVKKRYDVSGDLGFEDAQGWLVHALDVIRFWEKNK
jgi:hypothetical protein